MICTSQLILHSFRLTRTTQTKYLKWQLFSGELSLIASIIVLYIVYKNQNNENFGVADTENPVL